MSASKVQLTGGQFQDSEGNLLSGGYLTFKLSQDENVNDSQICAGIKVTVNLDGYGAVIGGQYIWGNDQLSPINSYYKVTGYKANGQMAWGSNNQQVLGNGGTFDVGSWIPNLITSWIPPLQPLLLQVNETPNGSQGLLDLHAGADITLVDNGSGRVTISSTSGGVALYTNEYLNSNQAELDLHAGSGISLVESGGMVTITNTSVYVPPTIGTSGKGGFFSAGFTMLPPYPLTGSAFMSTQNNQVRVWQFENLISRTISKVTTTGATYVSGTANFGIYDSTGNLLLDSGPFNSNPPVTATNAIPAVTLPPGVYYFAQAATNYAIQFYTFTNAIPGVNAFTLLNANANRVGYAANTLSGTTLPALLGAITAADPTATIEMVGVFFEP